MYKTYYYSIKSNCWIYRIFKKMKIKFYKELKEKITKEIELKINIELIEKIKQEIKLKIKIIMIVQENQ